VFEREKDALARALGQRLARIEHVGGTAVPGLAAKPVLDMVAVLRPGGDALGCSCLLRRLGYQSTRGGRSVQQAVYVRRPVPGRCVHAVRLLLTPSGGSPVTPFLLLRDFLRNHPETAAQFGRLKLQLAAKYGSDGKGYSLAKAAFLAALLKRARKAKTRHH
jgi:GrpB-like predicted nucleotidyltransferase (UPF0157 family)